MMNTKQQASEYVKRVGVAEAKKSSHYDIARRHCRCGTCFCCEVRKAVDAPIWVAHPESRSVPNLHVLECNGREVGMIEKPNDTPTDKNAWRAYAGIGARARFLGHCPTKRAAQALVEFTV